MRRVKKWRCPSAAPRLIILTPRPASASCLTNVSARGSPGMLERDDPSDVRARIGSGAVTRGPQSVISLWSSAVRRCARPSPLAQEAASSSMLVARVACAAHSHRCVRLNCLKRSIGSTSEHSGVARYDSLSVLAASTAATASVPFSEPLNA